MKRLLQALALCAAILLATHSQAQDASGGSGGDGSGAGGADTSGGDTSGGSQGNGGNSQGGGGSGTNEPGNGARQNGGSGNSFDVFNTNNNNDSGGGGGLFNNLFPNTSGSSGGGLFPSTTGSSPGRSNLGPQFQGLPQASPTPAALNPFAAPAGSSQVEPVTVSLPGGYGGGPPTTFTLGQGRLARPPLVFTFSVSEGLDDNINSAPSNPVPNPTPLPGPTPPLFFRQTGLFRINPPRPPTPIFETFRPAVARPSPVPPPDKPLASAVSTATVGVEVQRGTTRTILTLDASIGLTQYWNQPSSAVDYTGNFGLNFFQRLTPRAALTLEASAVYQQSPNFSLVNAPTANNSSSSYLNGTVKGDLSYAWTRRINTVTSLAVNSNISASGSSSDVIGFTLGNQFRYTVSARNTITLEIRNLYTSRPSLPGADSQSVIYLLGLDTIINSRIRNIISGGLEMQQFVNGGLSQTVPYLETTTSLLMPKGAQLVWTNRFGAEEPQQAGTTLNSFRSTLAYSRAFSTKISGSVSVAYNHLASKDAANSLLNYTQDQVQAGLNFYYVVSPRLTLSFSYNYFDLLSSQINGSYTRSQIYMGANYTFH